MAETTTQGVKVLQIPSTIKGLIEALIFAAKEPLSAKQMKAIYEQQGGEGEARTIDPEEIRGIIADLNDEFLRDDKPYRVVQIAGGYQFATLSQYAEWLGKLYKEQARRKLSQSSTETLAIIAYKQPISRPDIESIRGVNCDYVLATLLEKDLVTIVGRAPTPGRPLLYGTTREFLRHFGVNDITDLPRPREIEEILGESQFETERRMLEAQAGAGEMKKDEEDFKSRLPHIPKRRPDLDHEVKIVERSKHKEIKTIHIEEGRPGKTGQEKSEPTAGDSIPLVEIGQTLNDTGIQSGGQVSRFLSDEKDIPSPISPSTPLSVEMTKSKDENSESDKDTTISEVSQTEFGRDPNVANLVENTATDESPDVPKDELSRGIDESSRGFTISSNDTEDGIFIAVRATESNLTTPNQQEAQKPLPIQPERKSAWHNWKEKIQIFIRKLFG